MKNTVEQTETFEKDRRRSPREINRPESTDSDWKYLDDQFSLSSQSGQTEQAVLVRQKRLVLRDLLGSHVCVYPECKQAQHEWMNFATDISKEQVSIYDLTK